MTAGWGWSVAFCSACQDEYDPEGYVSEDEPGFCSYECGEAWDAEVAYNS